MIQKKFLLTLLFSSSTLLFADQFHIAVFNNTCRQMEVFCTSGTKVSTPLKLFPFTEHGFTVADNQLLTIEWHRIMGPLKKVRIGGDRSQRGKGYYIMIDPQQMPFRSNGEGNFTIMSDDGHYAQILTIYDTNKVQKALAAKS